MIGKQFATAPATRTRRAWIGAAGGGAAALLAGACAGPGPGAAGGSGSQAKTAVTPIRIWFHWSAQTGDLARHLAEDVVCRTCIWQRPCERGRT
jgi:hypothetical protein